uniref:Uncharacterized protein n=1 Tax=Arundo donax TaxID=35708 RepID=A0A0A9FVS5_ARUDO
MLGCLKLLLMVYIKWFSLLNKFYCCFKQSLFQCLRPEKEIRFFRSGRGKHHGCLTDISRDVSKGRTISTDISGDVD